MLKSSQAKKQRENVQREAVRNIQRRVYELRQHLQEENVQREAVKS